MVENGSDDDDDSGGDEEQDLLVVLALGNKAMGTSKERMEIEAFADQLEAAVTEAGVGEYDGDEFGGGECTLFFCGPDVDRLLAVLQPLLRRSPLCRGGHLVRMVADGNGVSQQQKLPIRGESKA
ncbi:MAG TPA: hypothetical protein VFD82_07480 [Planctomycetota bacterium]|nr:hypothetical protein [Planctomycetota bacterium]